MHSCFTFISVLPSYMAECNKCARRCLMVFYVRMMCVTGLLLMWVWIYVCQLQWNKGEQVLASSWHCWTPRCALSLHPAELGCRC